LRLTSCRLAFVQSKFPKPESVPHEFELIEWIRQQIPPHPRVKVGIGDDAAVLPSPHPADTLVTVDMLMEGVDFLIPPATPQQVGRKSLAVNLSDIAAMGGWPTGAVVSVALPRHGGVELAHGLQEGLQQMAARFDVPLVGGDTNTWDGPLVISVTVLGETMGRGPILRSGARPGDWIMVTGTFGGSILGHHLEFTPRVLEGMSLNQLVELHAMIDVSDGLAADLRHILDESRVGAVLNSEAIPISPEARHMADGRTPLEHALGDGEDFELVFTVSPEDGARLLGNPPFATPISYIGEIIAEPGLWQRDRHGPSTPVPELGWKHGFKGGVDPA